MIRFLILLVGFFPLLALGKTSWFPFGGYNPTYGAFVGGGYFYQNPELSLGATTVVTFVDSYQGLLSADARLSETLHWSFETKFTRGYERYYGSDGQQEPKDIFTQVVKGKTSVKMDLGDEGLSVGAGLEGKAWRENERKNDRRYFLNETTFSPLVFVEWDYRDRESSPTGGGISRIELGWQSPHFASHLNHDVFQLRGDFRQYFRLATRTVLALAARGGTSSAEPSYLYNYTLGGTDEMRGFHQNRFRGSQYYSLESELRFPIAWYFYGAVFGGVGDTFSNGTWSAPHWTKGIGLRLALPPDQIQFARLDVGWGEDQWGAFVDFGMPF